MNSGRIKLVAQGAVACRQGAYVHQRGPPPLSLPGDACPELPVPFCPLSGRDHGKEYQWGSMSCSAC